mgnify:CR=1 FL=1
MRSQRLSPAPKLFNRESTPRENSARRRGRFVKFTKEKQGAGTAIPEGKMAIFSRKCHTFRAGIFASSLECAYIVSQ